MKIQYIKSKETYDIESVEKINDNVVQITGNLPIQEYGFMLSEDGKDFDGDYSRYRTIYRTIEGGAQFSNNGNVWTGGDELAPSDTMPEDIPESYVLSNAELTECVADLMYEVSCLKLGIRDGN